jgi:hypothetical protein
MISMRLITKKLQHSQKTKVVRVALGTLMKGSRKVFFKFLSFRFFYGGLLKS